MRAKLIIFNLLFLGVLIPFIGGGDFSKLGYFFLLASILICIPLFGNIAKTAFFNKGTSYLFLFLLFYLISSMMDILGCVAIFGRLCAPIFFSLLVSIVEKHPQLLKIQRAFTVIWLALLCFYEFRSLQFLAENPQGLRELVSIKKDDSIAIGGGYSLPYALTLLVPSLVLFCKIGFTKKQKFIFLGLSVYYAFLVFSSLYMTANILIIIGVSLALIHGYSKTRKRIIISILCIVTILYYGFIPILIKELSPDGTEVLMRRFMEIDSILSGNDISDSQDFFARIQLSLQSIETFLDNPVFGIGWKYRYDFFELENAGVGSHAQWFDIFANYGIFALLLVGYLIKSAKPFMKKDNIAITLFVVLGFLNPCLQFTIIFVVYCLVPMLKITFNVGR